MNDRNTDREWLFLLIKDIQDGVAVPILYVVIDGKRHALDRVLQVGLRHCRVVDVDGWAAGRLLKGCEVPQGLGAREVHLRLFPAHPVDDGLLWLLHEHGGVGGVQAGVVFPVVRLSLAEVK